MYARPSGRWSAALSRSRATDESPGDRGVVERPTAPTPRTAGRPIRPIDTPRRAPLSGQHTDGSCPSDPTGTSEMAAVPTLLSRAAPPIARPYLICRRRAAICQRRRASRKIEIWRRRSYEDDTRPFWRRERAPCEGTEGLRRADTREEWPMTVVPVLTWTAASQNAARTSHRLTWWRCYELITDHCSGPGRPIGPVCLSVCLSDCPVKWSE